MLWSAKHINLQHLDTFWRPIFFITNIEMCNVNIQTLKRVISILFTSPVEMEEIIDYHGEHGDRATLFMKSLAIFQVCRLLYYLKEKKIQINAIILL